MSGSDVSTQARMIVFQIVFGFLSVPELASSPQLSDLFPHLVESLCLDTLAGSDEIDVVLFCTSTIMKQAPKVELSDSHWEVLLKYAENTGAGTSLLDYPRIHS